MQLFGGAAASRRGGMLQRDSSRHVRPPLAERDCTGFLVATEVVPDGELFRKALTEVEIKYGMFITASCF